MNQRTYSTEAIVLSRKNFGEADRIITIFSKNYGKLRVVAKGIRRLTSRKKGSLELFNHTKMFLVRGRGMDIITETELKNEFSNWRKDITRVGIAYHLCEVVEKLTAEGQDQEEVYRLLKLALEKLDKMKDGQLIEFVRRFKLRVLGDLGFLEKDKDIPMNIDDYIEELINGGLKTRRFLRYLR